MSNQSDSADRGRHGVVAVICEEGRFLVIRRSEWVRAPGLLCFPGGGIEAGEDFETAMHRELQEELSLSVTVKCHLWTSTTKWGTKLEWMHCSRNLNSVPLASPAEVSEIHWLTKENLRGRTDLLGSIPDFLDALSENRFQLD